MFENSVKVPFMTVPETSRLTGLSQYYLRIGCRNGTIPCVTSGNRFMINVPAYLRQLNLIEDDEEDS